MEAIMAWLLITTEPTPREIGAYPDQSCCELQMKFHNAAAAIRGDKHRYKCVFGGPSS